MVYKLASAVGCMVYKQAKPTTCFIASRGLQVVVDKLLHVRIGCFWAFGCTIARSSVIDIQQLVDPMALPNNNSVGSLQHAIDNVHMLGDVGGMSELRLRKILPHASTEHLLHIETCSKGRDLTSITDPLWRIHFARRFGERNAKMCEKQMPQGGPPHTWRSLYEEKVAEQEKLQEEGVERLRELYHQQNAVKASRKIQCIDKMAPEPTRKRAKTTPTLQNLPRRGPKQPAVFESRGFADKRDTAPVVESRGSVTKTKIQDMTPRVEKHRLWKMAIKQHHDHLRRRHATTDGRLVLPRKFHL